MGRYNPAANIASASVGFLILPKGDYEFSIGEAKPFANEKKDDDGNDTSNHGVGYQLTVVGGEFDGKTVFINHYMHTDKTAGMVKQFIMAALGYTIDDEGSKAFEEKYADADWSYDDEEGTVGDIWAAVAGQRIAASVDISVQTKGQYKGKQQNRFNWKPIA